MRAIVYHNYGHPDELKEEEVVKPSPKGNEILLKVFAASINSWDCDLVRGKPFLARIGGFRKPRFPILGADVSGIVEEVGRKVTRFKTGDSVFGDLSAYKWGGFAEYVCAPEDAFMQKPVMMTFEQAASIPQAGGLAVQAIFYNGPLEKGQSILINGAGGGVGTFAIQIAKSYGAEVTAVDIGAKLEMIRSTGADHTFDYLLEDFTKPRKKYDLIIDVMAHRSLFEYKRMLNPGGAYVMVGGSMKRIFQLMFIGPMISMAGNRKMGLLFHKANGGIEIIEELFASGKLEPVIDKCFPLNEVAHAVQYLGEGRSMGKVVIRIGNS